MQTKLWADPEERSQAGPQREEARLHGLAGLRLGWSGGREPVASAKSALPTPQGKFPAVAKCGHRQLVQTPVHHVIMSGTQCVHTTGEVPRRPLKVTMSYKQAVKGSSDATAAGTLFQRPCPQGCQQSQSSPPTRDERQNLPRSVKPSSVFGKVSPTTATPKWSAGTSSRQLVGLLRNILRYGVRSIRAKHQGQKLP
jgi:hypothetical protein